MNKLQVMLGLVLGLVVLVSGQHHQHQHEQHEHQHLDSFPMDSDTEAKYYACAYHFMHNSGPVNPTHYGELANKVMANLTLDQDERDILPRARFCSNPVFFGQHADFCGALETALSAPASSTHNEFSSFCRELFFGQGQQEENDVVDDGAFLEKGELVEATIINNNKGAADHKGKSHHKKHKHKHKSAKGQKVHAGHLKSKWWWKKAKTRQKDKHVCIFMHGTGMDPIVNGFVDNTFHRTGDDCTEDYWGTSMPGTVSDYCIPKFFFADTAANGWDSAASEKYCAAIKESGAKMVFTHSMGNLLVSNGVQKQFDGCNDFGTGPDDIHWYNVQGPFLGSEAANVLETICHAKVGGHLSSDSKWNSYRRNLDGFSQKLAKLAADKWLVVWKDTLDILNIIAESYCVKDGPGQGIDDYTGELKVGHRCLQVQNVEERGLQDTAAAVSSGSLCGTSPKSDCGVMAGLADRLGLEAIGEALVSWDSYGEGRQTTDGLVGVASCAFKNKQYGSSPDDAHTRMPLSHFDGTTQFCATTWGDSVKWYEARASSSHASLTAPSFLQEVHDGNAPQFITLGDLEKHMNTHLQKNRKLGVRAFGLKHPFLNLH